MCCPLIQKSTKQSSKYEHNCRMYGCCSVPALPSCGPTLLVCINTVLEMSNFWIKNITTGTFYPHYVRGPSVPPNILSEQGGVVISCQLNTKQTPLQLLIVLHIMSIFLKVMSILWFLLLVFNIFILFILYFFFEFFIISPLPFITLSHKLWIIVFTVRL